jgi:hypothetical protein
MLGKALLVAALALGLSTAYAADEQAFVGAKKCKICHSTDKKAGTHYKVWEEEAHAKAFEVLASDKAKEAAKKHGIDDPQKAEACLACHTVKATLGADDTGTHEEGVSCEACHGPAGGYLKIHEKEGYDAAVAAGMTPFMGMEKEAIAETCMKCHKEDPMNDFHKPFNFEEAWAKIDHSGATSPEVKAKKGK